MTDVLQLIIGVAGLTLVSFYIVWTRFRVFCVRQDLFQIRDAMWDKARKLECFDDPAYLEARAALNSLIKSAHKISLPVLIHIWVQTDGEDLPLPQSDRPEVQKAIDAAVEDAAACLSRYVIYYRPFSGILSLEAIRTICKTGQWIGTVRESIAKWFRSGGPGHLDALACR